MKLFADGSERSSDDFMFVKGRKVNKKEHCFCHYCGRIINYHREFSDNREREEYERGVHYACYEEGQYVLRNIQLQSKK